MSWFEDWFNSPYYDKLYQSHNEQEAHAFINNLIAWLKPVSGSKVADIPCGNGRFSLHLAEAGLEVYGFDLSDRKIKEASQLQNDKLRFACHDMRQPFHINYFDYVLNIFTSLGYFENDRQDVRVIKNFHSALKPGGKLVVDFFNTNYIAGNFKSKEVVENGGSLFSLNREYDGKSMIKNIDVTDNGKTYQYMEKVRAYTLPDFEKMLSEAGFNLVEKFGNYKLDKFDNNTSQRLILIAEKK